MTRFARYTCALLLALAACGGGDDRLPPGGADAGPRPDAGDPPDAGDTPDAPIDPAGPTVAIVAPTAPAAGDLSSGAIVTAERFVAVCEVTPNADSDTPVDSSSVVITAVAGATSIDVPAAPSGTANQFAATLDVATFPNGALEVRCSASDLGDPARTNSAQVATFLDLGPAINVFSPVAGTSYGQQVDVSFAVEERPVADGDTGAAIDEVAVTAAGIPLAVTETGGGTYFATLDFDAVAFDPPLAGPVELQITARNSRAATAVSRLARVAFVADVNGPVIAIQSPAAGELVGGFLEITANVTDPAGIGSVVATIAHDFQITLARTDGDTFVGTFDTRVLSDAFVFPLLEVRATDLAGNQAAIGRVIAVDNVEPLVSLDSPGVREAICLTGSPFCDEGDPRECSDAFDPLGSDAVDDGETVAALSELRVRIEDRGNGAAANSFVFVPRANVDPATVEIYLLDDETGALLVDTDGDGVCDDINPALVPSTFPDAANEAAVVSLTAVNPAGEARFDASTGPFGGDPTIADGSCQDPSEPQDAPTPVCASSPLTRIIASVPDGLPAIYGIPPLSALSCLGNAFDAPASNLSDGWVCVAARGLDALGNVGVSPPLRMCVDHDTDGEDAGGAALTAQGCAALGAIAAPASRPACTDGCTPPVSFEDIPAFQVRDVGFADPACNDGEDNDNDGLVDADDPQCLSSDDTSEAL